LNGRSELSSRQSFQWSGVTAIFGGTFDPPHLGHREAVAGLFRNPGVREVLVLPASSPPHKPAIASSEQRLELAKLAFAPGSGLPTEVSLDSRELERKGTTYSYDTLVELGRERGRERIAFVIGIDQLAQLPSWYRFPHVLGLSHWIVLKRRGSDPLSAALSPLLASNLLKPSGPETWSVSGGPMLLKAVGTDAPELSSTWIRQAIGRTGRVPKNSMVPEASAYLKAHRIYGTEGEET
jgi:nicotinate-nucleotide adenylyltransferase